MSTWIQARLLEIMFTIDNIIYSFITTLYELLMYLANLNLYGTEGFTSGLGEFTQRIYVLLGIFMLFKVSFSVLQYLVSPDTFSDKSKGMGKLITNVLVVLVLLVFTPTIFKFAYDVQGAILNSNAIPKLVFGTDTGETIGKDNTAINKTLAEDMEFLVFGSFVTVNTDMEEFSSCKGSEVLGTVEMAKNEGCLTAVNNVITSKTSSDIGSFFRIDEFGKNRNFQAFGDVVSLSNNNQWYFNYSWGFSTAAGLFIVVMLLSYCIAVAVRAVKLFFLQIIAPIPIVSYIDPKQGKDGTMMKWAKECGKTYISLFIRLAIIFLAFYLINLISSTILANDVTYYNKDNPEGIMNAFVTVMLILGILIFANQVPKLLEEIFGLKSTGEFSVNPLKSIKSSPLASFAVGGAVGAATGLATNFANTGFKLGKTIQAAKELDKNGNRVGFATAFGKNFANLSAGDMNKQGIDKAFTYARGFKNVASNTIGTWAGGTVGGALRSGVASKKGDFKDGIKKGHEQIISNREARDARQQQSVATRFTNKATQFAGAKNEFGTVGKADATVKSLQERLQQNSQIQEQMREQMSKRIISLSEQRGDISYQHIIDTINTYSEDIWKSEPNEKVATMDKAYADYMSNNSGSILTKTEFNEFMAAQSNIKDSEKIEKALKKEIKDNQRAGGMKEEDKK